MTVEILIGDAIERLRELPADSVHCCVTSPPYWGLRDYGTGEWEGGDQACDHKAPNRFDYSIADKQASHGGSATIACYRDLCRQCGARRVDQQIGLEASPEAWCARLVEVFREVKRVLRPDGTLWLNCGSSYVSGGTRSSQSRPQQHAQAGRGNGHLDCAPDDAGSSPPDALASTIPASSPSALAASDLACAVAVPSGALTSSPAMQASARTAASMGGKSSMSAPSSARNSGKASSGSACGDPFCGGCGVCWAYLAIPALRLKTKDLMMQAHLLALALQADGWWCRAEIVWNKPNPMPESTRDRCTKSHEQVFLLTKSERYFWDAEAIRERHTAGHLQRHLSTAEARGNGQADEYHNGDGSRRTARGAIGHDYLNPAGRNARSVWTIATEPYSEAHFATFPTELARRCILAGTSAKGCCPECAAPWAKMVERESFGAVLGDVTGKDGTFRNDTAKWAGRIGEVACISTGWRPTCECKCRTCAGYGGGAAWTPSGPTAVHAPYQPCPDCGGDGLPKPIPCTVLDPFGGSGTTGLVADQLGRNAVLIELSPKYAAMARRRIDGARARRMIGDVSDRTAPMPGQTELGF